MELIKFCWLNRHVPHRKQATWDGEGYVGTCHKCGKAIRRHRKGVWKSEHADSAPQPGGN